MNTPTLLLGAFDRHNFGDLLFPHIAAALLPGRRLIFAGLAERDLRPFGGHRTHALARLAAEFGNAPVRLIHVGGEILTCEAWHAALMLQPPAAVPGLVARLDAHPAERLAWARATLGLASLAPYVAGRRLFPRAQLIHAGVGGAGLQHCPPALRAEVIEALGEADAVGVRDRQTLAHLHAAGIPAHLMPDPAVLTAECFGPAITAHATRGEVAAIARRFPRGYLAVQFSAAFGDDASLDSLAAQLDRAAAGSGCGIVLFRAGSAPWHDDADCLTRLARRLPAAAVQVCQSLQLWDICALIAGSRGYCGSSLHGRIVATAFARPRLNVLPPQTSEPGKSKIEAGTETWESPALPATSPLDALAARLCQALAADPATLRGMAGGLAARYLRSFAAHRPNGAGR